VGVRASALAGFLMLALLAWPGVVAAQAPVGKCAACHLETGDERLAAPARAFDGDIHKAKGFGCVACHGGDANADGMEAMSPAKGFVGKPSRQLSLGERMKCELAAALLPCMWSFAEIGQALAARGLPAEPRYDAPKSNMELLAAQVMTSVKDASIELLRGTVANVISGEPLHIELPAQGLLYRFAKLYANQSAEDAHFSLRYVHRGAGFAGLAAARGLARAPFDVVVVDRANHHLFQPLLYQVATAGLSPLPRSSGIVHSGRRPSWSMSILLDARHGRGPAVPRRPRRRRPSTKAMASSILLIVYGTVVLSFENRQYSSSPCAVKVPSGLPH